jgi:phenylpyruvate tautomerase PptA (4-oxalocrotonate tautomerase family)
VPYLQLDVPGRYPLDVKRRLAKHLGDTFARIMETTPDNVSVGIRELADGVWRCGDGEPQPAAVLMCDIRRGRPPEQRAALAQALLEACAETLGLGRDGIAVEFTQHAGDEMYRDGRGWAADWTAAEAKRRR